MNINNKTIAVNLLRASFGINFLFHGLVRIPKIDAFALSIVKGFENTILPNILVTPIAYAIPFIEVIIGLFLLINKFTREAIITAFVLLNILTFGSAVQENWTSVAVKLTYLGFLFLLLFHTKDKNSNPI